MTAGTSQMLAEHQQMSVSLAHQSGLLKTAFAQLEENREDIAKAISEKGVAEAMQVRLARIK